MKYKKRQKITKKRKAYTLVFKKLFGFQNKYIVVLNNFLKRLNNLPCHLHEFCSPHTVPLKNTSLNQHLLVK